jgi:hypothetical protein
MSIRPLILLLAVFPAAPLPITAREIDQQYEWSAHEPAGLRAGLEQPVIDAVKYEGDVTGLTEKDATLIRFGRARFREHRVSSDLWAKVVEHFGRQRATRGGTGRATRWWSTRRTSLPAAISAGPMRTCT